MAEQEAVSPPPEAQAPAAGAAAGGGGEGEEVVEMFSKTFGIPKEVVAKALSRNETLERAQALIQLLGQLSQLPSEVRKAVAPLVASSASDVDAEMKQLLKWMVIFRSINDPTPQLFVQLLAEERKRSVELQQLLIKMLTERDGKKDKEVVQAVQQMASNDPLENITKQLESVRKLAELLGFKREEDGVSGGLADALSRITEIAEQLKKLGFDVKPAIAEEHLRRIEEEAYKRGMEEGVRRAEHLAELGKTALERLGPALNELLSAIARKMQGAAVGEAVGET
jgi:DNA-binding transcriptional ArsR family regulator